MHEFCTENFYLRDNSTREPCKLSQAPYWILRGAMIMVVYFMKIISDVLKQYIMWNNVLQYLHSFYNLVERLAGFLQLNYSIWDSSVLHFIVYHNITLNEGFIFAFWTINPYPHYLCLWKLTRAGHNVPFEKFQIKYGAYRRRVSRTFICDCQLGLFLVNSI